MKKLLIILSLFTIINYSCNFPKEDPCKERLVVLIDKKEIFTRGNIVCQFGRCEFTGEDGRSYSGTNFEYYYKSPCK